MVVGRDSGGSPAAVDDHHEPHQSHYPSLRVVTAECDEGGGGGGGGGDGDPYGIRAFIMMVREPVVAALGVVGGGGGGGGGGGVAAAAEEEEDEEQQSFQWRGVSSGAVLCQTYLPSDCSFFLSVESSPYYLNYEADSSFSVC